jgi:hypothetical protein
MIGTEWDEAEALRRQRGHGLQCDVDGVVLPSVPVRAGSSKRRSSQRSATVHVVEVRMYTAAASGTNAAKTTVT